MAIIGKAAGGCMRADEAQICPVDRVPSGRNHKTGRFIHYRQQELELQVLVTGSDRCECVLADGFKVAMVRQHNPSINVSEKAVKGPLSKKWI